MCLLTNRSAALNNSAGLRAFATFFLDELIVCYFPVFNLYVQRKIKISTRKPTGRQAERKNDFLTGLFQGAAAGAVLMITIYYTVCHAVRKDVSIDRLCYYVVRIELTEGFRVNPGSQGTKPQRLESHRNETGGHYTTLVQFWKRFYFTEKHCILEF